MLKLISKRNSFRVRRFFCKRLSSHTVVVGTISAVSEKLAAICRRFVRKKRYCCPRAGATAGTAAAAAEAAIRAPRTRTIPTAAAPTPRTQRLLTDGPSPIGYRAFSGGASSRKSSTGRAPRTSSATFCGSTGTGANTAGSASASASA